jgi:hypothetical protein
VKAEDEASFERLEAASLLDKAVPLGDATPEG